MKKQEYGKEPTPNYPDMVYTTDTLVCMYIDNSMNK